MKTIYKNLRLLILLQTLPIISFSAFSSNLNIYGDVNHDDEVNIADVNAVIDIIMDINSVNADADVNNDGEINIADVNAIIDIILNGQPQAVVHVYGDDGPTEGTVINVTDNSVTVTCDPVNAPKPGEIIVCGVAENAPVGFLRRVETIQSNNEQYVMTTTDASLEEVLPDGDYDLPIPMAEEGQYVMIQAPGQQPQRMTFSTTLKLGVKIGSGGIRVISDVSNAEEADVLDGDQDKTYPVKFIARLTPSLEVNFICSRHNKQIERLGLKGKADITADILGKISTETTLHLLGENGVKLFTVHLEPVPVWVGYIPIPIVFTPRIEVFLTIDLSGEVYIKSRFVAARATGEFSYIYTPTPDPITGQNHHFTKNFTCSAIGDGNLGDRIKETFAPKVGVNGAITAAVSPTLNVSVYGGNDIFNVGIPISPWVKAEGDLALTLEKDTELDYDDQIIISGGVDIGLSAKFKLGKANLKWGQDVTLFESQLLEPIGITPRFENFDVDQGPDMSRLSMDMTKPNIQFIPDQDYGFAYGLTYDKRREKWKFVSVKDSYDSDFTPLHRTQYMETYVDMSKLNKDSTYQVRPYVKLLGCYVFKKGDQIEGKWVNLGLPSGTIWATRNIGADISHEYGDYFAWGETMPKSVYNWDTYNLGFYDESDNWHWTKYHYGFWVYVDDYSYFVDSDGKTELEPYNDAANVNWGSSARMPSVIQIHELYNTCKWQWTTKKGVYGQLGIGPNGNTLFLPAAGWYWDSSNDYAGAGGYYWTRTLHDNCSDLAYLLGFNSETLSWVYTSRGYGLPVRAVNVSKH